MCDPAAGQPESVSMLLAPLLHAAEAESKSEACGREVTVLAVMPLLTSLPVSGAVFCSDAVPPSK